MRCLDLPPGARIAIETMEADKVHPAYTQVRFKGTPLTDVSALVLHIDAQAGTQHATLYYRHHGERQAVEVPVERVAVGAVVAAVDPAPAPAPQAPERKRGRKKRTPTYEDNKEDSRHAVSDPGQGQRCAGDHD